MAHRKCPSGLMLLALLLLGACDAPPPQTPAAPGSAGAAPHALYGQRPADNQWPGPADAGLSPDLLSRNYYLVLDASGSMMENRCSNGKTKMAVAQAALKQFVDALPPQANLGLLVFDYDGVAERVPLGPGQQSRVKRAIEQVQANGNTPLASAIQAGYRALSTQGRRQLGYGEYHLVVVTDGEASPGEEPDQAVQTLLQQSPLLLHTIGFCISNEHSLNQPGRVNYRAVQDAKGLVESLEAILAESPQFDPSQFEPADATP